MKTKNKTVKIEQWNDSSAIELQLEAWGIGVSMRSMCFWFLLSNTLLECSENKKKEDEELIWL